MRIWILFLALFFVSCTTQRRCLKKFPPQTVIERSDTTIYKDSIVYHDLIVRDTIRADTVFKERLVKVPVNLVILPIEAENEYARARAWIENRKLKLELTQKERVIKRIIADARKESFHWEAQYRIEKIKNQTTVYKPKKIHKISMWFSASVILLFLAWIYYKFIR